MDWDQLQYRYMHTKIFIMHMYDYPGIGAAICNSCNGINQQCLIPGVCTCVEGWTGPKCEIGIIIMQPACNLNIFHLHIAQQFVFNPVALTWSVLHQTPVLV